MAYKKILKVCEYCKDEYNGIPKSKFCSQKCYGNDKQKRITKLCIKCSTPFVAIKSRQNRIFCSVVCANSILNKSKGKNQKRGKDNPLYTKIEVVCEYCKNNFYKTKSVFMNANHHLCSKKCLYAWLPTYRKSKTEYLIKKCKHCNIDILKSKAQFNCKYKNITYCSRECSFKHGKGGFKPQTKQCKNCNLYFTIYKRNDRHIMFCSTKCRIENIPKGIKHFNYNIELSEEDRDRNRSSSKNTIFREAVLARDSFKCQVCFINSNNLNVHHIENYSSCKDKRYLVNNGITLCYKCHKGFHSKYGVVNNNILQLQEFKSSFTIELKKSKEI